MRFRLQAIAEGLRKPFEEGGDYYKVMTARVMNKPVEEVTKEERQRMKECIWVFFTYRAPIILTDLIQGEDTSE